MTSLQRLFAIAPGFNPSNLLTMRLQTSIKFDAQTIHQFFTQSLDAVRQVPGVTAVEMTSQSPLSGDIDQYGAHFEHDDREVSYHSFRYALRPEYAELTQIPLERA